MFNINIGFRLNKDLFNNLESTRKFLWEKHRLRFNRNQFIRTLLEYGLAEMKRKFEL